MELLFLIPIPTLICFWLIEQGLIENYENSISQSLKTAIALGISNYIPSLVTIFYIISLGGIFETSSLKCTGLGFLWLVGGGWIFLQTIVGLSFAIGSFFSRNRWLASASVLLLNLSPLPASLLFILLFRDGLPDCE